MGRYVVFLFAFLNFCNYSMSTWIPKFSKAPACNIISTEEENNIRTVGEKTWPKGCPNGGYVKAVYSDMPNVPFLLIKCCGDISSKEMAWEFHDIPSLNSRSNNGLYERWDVECPADNTVISGFRYVKMRRNAPKGLSSMRCSLMKNKIFNKSQCVTLDFSATVNSSVSINQTWQHECPENYALVGLYDNYNFQSIQSAKCCKLEDFFLPGWSSNFTSPNSGFHLSQKGGISFKLDEKGSLAASRNAVKHFTPPFDSAILISSGIANLPLCLNLTWEITPLSIVVSLEVLLKTSTNLTTVKILKPNYDGRRGLLENTNTSEQIWVDGEFSDVAQIYINVSIWRGDFILKRIQVDSKSQCTADRCENINGQAKGCKENEICDLNNGFNQCVCGPGYRHSSEGKCVSVNTPIPTDGGGKGGFTHEPRKTDRIYNATTQSTTTEMTLSTKKSIHTYTAIHTAAKTEKPSDKKEKINSSTLPVWVHSLVISAFGITVLLLIIGGFLCYRRTLGLKHGRLNSFEQELAIINSGTLLSHKYLRESVTTLGASTKTLFRPFMQDLGSVEYLSPPSRNNSFAVPTVSPNMVIDPTTGEPIYTRINRSVTIEEEQETNVDELVECPASNNNCQILDEKRIEKDNILYDPASPRRPSCSTLIHPDYGDPESDDYEEQSAKTFVVPGDDEEELLDELNQLTPESIRVSTKILGQGAFGLVKYGKLVTVNGTNEVAVKILKQRSRNEITHTDRIKFYQEAVIMSQFDHENVISLYGVVVGKSPCMVIEYLSRGSLWKYLNKIRRIREREGLTEINYELHCLFLKMARDIAAGMEYLASLNFIHRDLAARNILLDGQLNCKISDFGLSRHFLKDDDYYTSQGGQIPVKWTAPEALQFRKYSVKSDVWSYGVVLWEIWSLGLRPYDNWVNDKVLKEVCEKAYRLPAPKDIPKLIYRLIIDCWHPDKNNRPTFSQLVFCFNHPNERILGKQLTDVQKSKMQRTRSVTWNIEDEINLGEEAPLGDLQSISSKTD